MRSTLRKISWASAVVLLVAVAACSQVGGPTTIGALRIGGGTLAAMPAKLLPFRLYYPTDAPSGFPQLYIGDPSTGNKQLIPSPIPGPQGPQGQPGQTGATGSNGVSPVLNIGTVTALSPGSTPTATLTGTAAAPVLNLGIATGNTGLQGLTGATGMNGVSPTIAVGTVTTGVPGSPVTFTNAGTSSNAVFNISIPAGPSGGVGPAGAMGNTGPAGISPVLSIGNTTVLSYGATPTATITGTSIAPILTLGLPASMPSTAGGDLSGNYPSPTLATVTTAGTVGSATAIPVITYDSKGRIVSATTASLRDERIFNISSPAFTSLSLNQTLTTTIPGGGMSDTNYGVWIQAYYPSGVVVTVTATLVGETATAIKINMIATVALGAGAVVYHVRITHY